MDDLNDATPGRPQTDALRFTGDQGTRVIVRPSGTEPKLKAYVDVHTTTGTGSARRRSARHRAEQVADELDALLTCRVA